MQDASCRVDLFAPVHPIVTTNLDLINVENLILYLFEKRKLGGDWDVF